MILALTSDTWTAARCTTRFHHPRTADFQRAESDRSRGRASLPRAVELNPTALNSYGIALDDVRARSPATRTSQGSVEDGDALQIRPTTRRRRSEYVH